MTAQPNGRFWRAAPVWAGMTFASFGGIVGLAMSEAINPVTTTILLIIPAALFFQTLRVAGSAAPCSRKGEAQRRYLKRVLVFSSAYLLAFAIQVAVFDEVDPPLALRAALGVLPALAILGIFWAMGRLMIEERDEFIRMLIVRQALIATALALSFATIWGFLEAADVVAHIDAYWIAVIWFFGQFVGAVSNRITYGSWGAL